MVQEVKEDTKVHGAYIEDAMVDQVVVSSIVYLGFSVTNKKYLNSGAILAH